MRRRTRRPRATEIERERERGKGQRRNGRGEVEKGGRETRVEGCMERGDKGMEKELATPLGR